MNEEQQSTASEEQPALPSPEPPPGVAAGRTRGNPLALGRPLLLLLLLCGLLPAAILAWYDWGRWQQQASHFQEYSQHLSEQAGQMATLNRQVQDAVEKWRAANSALRRQLHLAQAGLAALRLVGKLQPLVAGKSSDEIAADKSIPALLKKPPPPLHKLVLLDSKAERLLAEVPGLTAADRQQALAAPAAKALPDGDSWSSWRRLAVPGTGLEVAYNLQAASAAAEFPVPRMEIPATPASDAAANLSRPFAWPVPLGISALVLLLSLLVSYWHKKRLLRPLARLTELAGQLASDPDSLDSTAIPQSSSLPDLSLSLERLRGQLQRLQQMELAEEQRRRDLDLLEEYFRNLAEGRFVTSPQLASSELQSLSLAAQQLGNKLSGRLEAVVMVAGRVQQHAEELAELSGNMEISVAPLVESDHTALADLLSVELDNLCRHIDQLPAGSPLDGELLAAGKDLDKQRTRLSTLSNGLLEYSQGLVRSGRDILRAHEQARLLATNLALVAGSHPPPGLEGLKDKVDELGELLAGMSSVLPERLAEMAGLVEQLQQAVQRLEGTISGEQKQVLQLREKLGDWSDDITAIKNKVPVIRPLTGPLGNNYRQLTRQAAEMHGSMSRLNDDLARTSRVASNLAEAAQGLINEISLLHPDLPAPAVVSHELARTQHALEQAVKHIEQLAAAQGIQSLSPQASEILQQIHEVAEKARRNVVTSATSGANDGGTV